MLPNFDLHSQVNPPTVLQGGVEMQVCPFVPWVVYREMGADRTAREGAGRCMREMQHPALPAYVLPAFPSREQGQQWEEGRRMWQAGNKAEGKVRGQVSCFLLQQAALMAEQEDVQIYLLCK